MGAHAHGLDRSQEGREGICERVAVHAASMVDCQHLWVAYANAVKYQYRDLAFKAEQRQGE